MPNRLLPKSFLTDIINYITNYAVVAVIVIDQFIRTKTYLFQKVG